MRHRARSISFAACCLVAAVAVLAPLGPSASRAAEPNTIVKQLIVEQLADVPGKEIDVLTVEYAPGGSSTPHRHDADVYVYVLQGTLEMQVAGHELVRLKPGDTFIEHPDDVHAVSRNPSKTESAMFLVVALKASGKPLTRSVEPAKP